MEKGKEIVEKERERKREREKEKEKNEQGHKVEHMVALTRLIHGSKNFFILQHLHNSQICPFLKFLFFPQYFTKKISYFNQKLYQLPLNFRQGYSMTPCFGCTHTPFFKG